MQADQHEKPRNLVLDALFGRPSSTETQELIAASRPPQAVRIAVTILYAAFLISLALTLLGGRGWLPFVPRLDRGSFSGAVLFGLLVSFAQQQIWQHYQRRARAAFGASV